MNHLQTPSSDGIFSQLQKQGLQNSTKPTCDYAFSRMSFPSSALPFETPSGSTTGLCSEALNIALDEDIFADARDFEPTPINEGQMTVSTGQDSLTAASLMGRLERSLNEVMHSEGMTLSDMTTSSPSTFASSASESTIHQVNKRSADLQDSRPAKRSRPSDKKDDVGEVEALRFRNYQASQWTVRFQELLKFRQETGHCAVPHGYPENPTLARWVKRQRYQYKLKLDGRSSTMTDDRIISLEAIGFVWDSHGVAWVERLNELQSYAKLYRNCNVPSNCPGYFKLSSWVKCQRRQYKLFQEGLQSNITPERIAALEKLGFEWELRKSSKKAQTKK